MGQSDKNNGQIFFWYHEMEQDTGKKPYEKNIFKVTKTLEDFINSLYTPKQESYGKLVDIFNGDDEGIKKLLDSGWDIDTPCEFNQTLIQRVALADRVWLVEELIKRGAKLDGAIEQSINLNSFESLKLLLSAGANIEELNKQSYTPLQKSVIANKPKAVQLLLEYGPNKNVIDEFGDTPLEIALYVRKLFYVYLSHHEMKQYLLKFLDKKKIVIFVIVKITYKSTLRPACRIFQSEDQSFSLRYLKS
jgi:ankyrin repeat protein